MAATFSQLPANFRFSGAPLLAVTNRKFWLVARTKGYQLENLVIDHLFLDHICSLKWVLGGLNEK